MRYPEGDDCFDYVIQLADDSEGDGSSRITCPLAIALGVICAKFMLKQVEVSELTTALAAEYAKGSRAALWRS